MQWDNSNVRRNLAVFHTHTVFRNLDFSRGLFVVFLLSNGVTNLQIGVLQSLLFWTTFLLEIPSGIFADKFKRKYSLILGNGLLLVAFLLYFAPPDFSIYLTIFALTGAGFAFISGAGGALLFDGLKEAGDDWLKKHIVIMSQNRSYSVIAITVATLIGGFVFDINNYLIFGLTAIALGLALVSLYFIPESSRASGKDDEPSEPVIPTFMRFFRTKKGKRLFLFILGMGFLEGAHTPFFIFAQSLFKDYDLSGKHIGFILALGYLISSLGMYFAPKLGKVKLRTLIFWTTIGVSVSAGLIVTRPTIELVILLFLIINTLPNILFIHTDQYIHEHCETSIRASLLSVQSFMNSIIISFSYALVGYYGDKLGIHRAMSLLAFIPILTLVILSIYFIGIKESNEDV